MKYFVKSMYHGKTTIYERSTFAKALRFAHKLRSKHGVETCVYTDKGDASTWNKTTWNEFYADLIKEVCDD